MTQALPEIVLAVGAMALLMLGAYRERSDSVVSVCSILLLIAAAVIVAVIPNGTIFGTSFIVDDFARFMKILAYAGSAFAIVMSLDYLAMARQQTFEYPILIVLSTVGMGMLISAGDLIALYLGLELMSSRALRGRRIEPRFRAIDRSGPQVFRARRAVVGDAAVRLLADLRLHRQRVVRRHCQGIVRRAASG